jgi:hypothetical protein
VERSGVKIEDHPLSDAVRPNISYSLRYLEFDACIGAGLDLYKWYCTNFYPIYFKAVVMAFWRLHKLVLVHTDDAAYRKAKSKGQGK